MLMDIAQVAVLLDILEISVIKVCFFVFFIWYFVPRTIIDIKFPFYFLKYCIDSVSTWYLWIWLFEQV